MRPRGPGTDLRAAVRAFAPFSAAAVLAWTVVLFGSRVDWSQYALATGLALVAGTLAVAGHAEGGPGRASVWCPAALLFLAAVAFLRNSVGGTNSGTSALAMIPVFYTALYGRSGRQLAVVVAGVGLFYLLPIVIVGAPAYPQSQYRTALLSVTVSAIIGFATQQLVASVRRQAREARDREQMLEQLGDVVHRLFDSAAPRADVCEAARSISGATVALHLRARAGRRGAALHRHHAARRSAGPGRRDRECRPGGV